MAESQTLYEKYQYELRQAIASAMGDNITGTPDSGDATSLVDAERGGEANDYYNGQEIHIYSGTNVGVDKTVSDFATTTGDFTIPTCASAIDTTSLYEIHNKFKTAQYNSVINRAIDLIKDQYFKEVNDTSLYVTSYTKGEQGEKHLKREYDIPSGFDYIQDVYIESSKPYQLESCDSAWSESSDSDVTVSADTDRYQEGSASLKLVVAATISDGDIMVTQAIDSIDLSPYSYVRFMFESSVDLAAADLVFHMDDTASCASAVEKIDFPAITANTPTLVQLTLANPLSDTAIISIGLEYNANSGAATFWLDDVCVSKTGEPRFDECDRIQRNDWSILPGSTPKIKLHSNVVPVVGRYMRLVGQVSQAVLTSDSSTCFVPPEYIIQQGIAMLYQTVATTESAEKLYYLHQSRADKLKKSVRTVPLPGSKSVKEV